MVARPNADLLHQLLRGDQRYRRGPILYVHVADLSTGVSTTLTGNVESTVDALQWLPGGDGLVENRYAK